MISTTGKLSVQGGISNTNNSLNLQGDGDGEISGAITTALSVNKTGNGTWKLSGPSSHTNTTTVNAGRLVLSGSVAGPLTVSTGTLAPQGTPASTSSLNVQANGRLEVRPGDNLTIGTTVTLAGNLDVIAPPGLTPGSSFTLLTKTSAGAISGTFAGKPQGAVFSASGYLWQIAYNGGNGNDLALTIQPTALTAVETWRQLHFGTTDNSGNAANSADANNDGEVNLIEFATGQSPHSATRAGITLLAAPDSMWEFTYKRDRAAFDQGYLFDVEFSDSLAPESWTPTGPGLVLLNGPTQSVRAMIPAGPAKHRFIRLKVSGP